MVSIGGPVGGPGGGGGGGFSWWLGSRAFSTGLVDICRSMPVSS